LLSFLKSIIGSGDRDHRRSEVDVTVERKPEPEQRVASEEERPPGEIGPEPGGETAESPDVDAETEVEVTAPGEEVQERPDEESVEGEDFVGDTETESGVEEPLTTIKGIGPKYAERLESAGIESIEDLAESDLEALSEKSDISVKRLQRWRDKAVARVS
ncbi:MAG: helix-hairpin-helix domain-containing protein, partial [Halobacteriaceae archaeon]